MKKSVAEYVLVSTSMFGDSEEHTVRMEFDRISSFLVEFAIWFDGVKQEVFYPESWDRLFPKDPHRYCECPYFVINLDDLR